MKTYKKLRSIYKGICLCLLGIFFFSSCEEKKNPLTSVKTTEYCSNIHKNDSITLTNALADIRDSMQTKTGVLVLEEGGTAMVTRAWLTEYAEKTIDIQYFIFSLDNVGLIACDYLVRAADRGIQVRLLVDDIMVDADIQDILTLDSHENITIKIYNPGVNLGKNLFSKIEKFATDFRSANQRMHNKTFIVDGDVVITGGRNIADEYFDYDHEYNFRDRDVLLLGKETRKVNKSFQQFWDSELSVAVTDLISEPSNNVTAEDRFQKLHEYACNPDNFWPQVRENIESLPDVFPKLKTSGAIVWVENVEFASDEPGKNDGNSGLGGGGISTSKLLRLIKNADTAIDIQSPYLITTELSRDLFKAATERGVKIRILTNSLASTDNLEAFSGYQKDRQALLETGVRIFEFRPDAAERKRIMTGALQETIHYQPIFGLHAKTMVIDGTTTVIGTFNLDPRSANLNTECIAIIHSETISKSVLVGIEEEFKKENAWETTTKWNPDGKVSNVKRLKTWTRKIIPKDIL